MTQGLDAGAAPNFCLIRYLKRAGRSREWLPRRHPHCAQRCGEKLKYGPKIDSVNSGGPRRNSCGVHVDEAHCCRPLKAVDKIQGLSGIECSTTLAPRDVIDS